MLVVMAGAIFVTIPSSSRASNFVKVGSPFSAPINLYGVTTLYDRAEKTYKAWAVGGLVFTDPATGTETTTTAVMMYFNGSYWAKVPIPPVGRPLRSVSVIQYLRTIDSAGNRLTQPKWALSGWAVGDKVPDPDNPGMYIGATILKLDPDVNATNPLAFNSWTKQRKIKPPSSLAGKPCPEDFVENLTLCTNWTENNLKAVAAVNDRLAVAVGEAGTVLHYDLSFDKSIYTSPSYDTTVEYWNSQSGFAPTDTINAVTFLDEAHGWLAGANTSVNEGRVWKYTKQSNQYDTMGSLNIPDIIYTSIAATLRPSLTSGDPLKSVLWLGTTFSAIPSYGLIRFDEKLNRLSSTYGTGAPVSGISLTRRAGGQDQNLLQNGSFNADRKDESVSKRIPDGWELSSPYYGGSTNFTSPLNLQSANLVDRVSGNPAYVGESAQSVTKTDGVTARTLVIHHSGLADYFNAFSNNFPNDTYASFSSGSTPVSLQMEDATTPLMSTLVPGQGDYFSLPTHANSNGYVGPPVQVGLSINGFLRIPGVESSDRQYEFKIEHPKGWVNFDIENDVSGDTLVCHGGSNHGAACTSLSDPSCTSGGGVCSPSSQYPANSADPVTDNSLIAWNPGICQNDPLIPTRICVGGSNEGEVCDDPTDCLDGGTCFPSTQKVQCFNNDECNIGRCFEPNYYNSNDNNIYSVGPIRCTNDETCQSVYGNNASCVPFNSPPNCVDAPSTGESTSKPIEFRQGDGFKARVCDGGANSGRSCVDSSQCPGSACGLKGLGWFPFTLRYFQPWKRACSGSPMMRCYDNSDCVAPAICENTDLSYYYEGQCTKKDGTVTGTCSSNVNDANGISPCGYENDAYGNPTVKINCQNIRTKPDRSSLKVSYREVGAPTWNPVQDSDLLVSANPNFVPGETDRASIVQEVPFTTLPGTSFSVSGKYKIEFPNDFLPATASPSDPRQPKSPQAGIRVRCTNGTNDACGYDVQTFQANSAIGVSGPGTSCRRPDGTTYGRSCTTNAQCDGGDTCVGQWVDFSATVTKQNRNAGTGLRTADDPSQGLVIECFADYGARVGCDDITVVPLSEAALSGFDQVDAWAVDEGGAVYQNTLDFNNSLPDPDPWRVVVQPSAVPLRSVAAADSYHLWSVGDKTSDANATILRLSPGNVSGWAWIGASSSASSGDALGWIDFNCGNLQSCVKQPSNFGVNVELTGDEAGRIAGSAWQGTEDPNDVIDYGPCIGGDGSPTTSPSCDVVCSNNSLRLCSNSSQCEGTCSKNQGFRCSTDADCQVSCAANPVACRSIGWLSFDKKVTGTPPELPYNTAYDPDDRSTYYTAKFDNVTDKIDGWARFELGQCSVSKQSCFQSTSCPLRQSCEWSGAASVPGQIPAAEANAKAGWVKLRGDDNPSSPVTGDFFGCQDCTEIVGGTTPGYCGTTSTECGIDLDCLDAGYTGPDAQCLKTCKICTKYSSGAVATDYPACNSCSRCTLKRCKTQNANQRCTGDYQCNDIAGDCQKYGITDDGTGNICFGDLADGTKCVIGAQCISCNSCSKYGVSLDVGDTKNFSGFAWSPDLGWIDFSLVTLGGQAFFQTKFGDIYAGGDIGSTATGLPPGYPGGSAQCNATYRIVSAGTITNFCSAAPGGLASPFIEPGAQLFPLPVPENRFTARIGSLDIEGLTAVAKTVGSKNFNKYGDEVVDVPDGEELSHVCDGAVTAGRCDNNDSKLLGKVYHVKGDFVIDRDFSFNAGVSSVESGAGTFVIDGVLRVQGNTSYPPAGALIQNRRQLPSAGFFVLGPGGITVEPNVSKMVGAYYANGQITVNSSGSGGDNQLVVSGLMVAKTFGFQRTFRGISGEQQPAEQVIYDGRLTVNTPPGFSQLAQGLPNLQEVVP
ncbi:MAG: hypothetical protein HY420_02990 [Candidatus Kerfeldbacteria bacterium]|nr:hypothetical protein [Candidatus Kerfeldbacteria bacterium]